MDAKLNFLFAVLLGVIIISLAMSFRSCGQRPPIPPYFDRAVSIDHAVSRGAREETTVMAVFSADWCGACMTLKNGALSSSSVQAWVDDYAIPVYVDVTRARSGDHEAKVLMTRYRVESLPTILLIQDGQEIGRVSGAIPRRELLKWLRTFSEPD